MILSLRRRRESGRGVGVEGKAIELEATDITAGYGGADILQTVGVRLRTGEFVGLLGPNGSGKSTLLRVLSCVLRPRLGSVTLDGKNLTQWTATERAQRIAFAPQQETAAFDFSVREVVLMGRYPHRQRLRSEAAADYAVVAQALAETDLTALADRPVTALSGGEHRRVLLARALAQQTPLLLLDEPTAHLDITHQAELLLLTRRLVAEKGIGAMAALHDLNQAAEFCDRLILMRSGKIVAEGTAEAVFTTENLRRVYDADAQIGTNPATGRPFLFALRPLPRATQNSGR